MKNKLFEEIKRLDSQRISIWEKIEGDSHIATVTSGAADEVLNELIEYYKDYDEDAINYSVDLPIITVVIK